MITHITVEDAAKLISRIAGTNETHALTYIREAADRGEIQAADVAPVRHGRWNDINPAVLKPGVNWVCRCSECGCPQDYKHNYCPNCGARMDKEDEHETD